MKDFTAKEAHEKAQENIKAIGIAKGIVEDVREKNYENGNWGYGTYSVAPIYQQRVIQWINQNYPEYTVRVIDTYLLHVSVF